MSCTPLIVDKGGGEKFQALIETNSSEEPAIQVSPILLLTVEYPENVKLDSDFSKSGLQTVDLRETLHRPEALPYSVLDLGSAVLTGDASYEVYEDDAEGKNSGRADDSSEHPSLLSLIDDHTTQPPLEFDESTKGAGSPRDGQMERFEDTSSTLSDEESVHVIADKPVTCRALASLPAAFLYFDKPSSSRVGVFARQEIPRRARFGPVEGDLREPLGITPSHSLHLSIEDSATLYTLDVSNENTSNWMRYVRVADSSQDQNLRLHQSGKELYFSATRKIVAGEELKAWYGLAYAKSRGLPLYPPSAARGRRRNRRTSWTVLGKPTPPPLDSSKSSDAERWKCTHCERLFRSATLFNLHVLTHAADDLETASFPQPQVASRSKKTFRCRSCPKTFSSAAMLSLHLQTQHTGKVLECPICKKLFSKVSEFRGHIYSHASQGRFTCPICIKSFSEYKPIRDHMRRFHCGKNYGCEQCPKKFSTLDKLKIHLLSHSDYREFSCATCGKQFKRKDKLSRHLKNNHCLPDPLSLSKKEEEYAKSAYRCEVCVVGYKRRGMLVNHFATRHPQVSLDSLPQLNTPIYKERKDYFCQYCGKVYKSSTKRKMHIVKNHPGKKLPCISSKVSMNESYSQTAGRVSKLPQGCEWCYKQYASKAKLLQHQRKSHPAEHSSSLRNADRGSVELELDTVDRVTDTDIFLSHPLDLSEYELSVGEGEFIVDANTLKRAMKGDPLGEDSSVDGLLEVGHLMETRGDGYFKVYQGPSGVVAQPVEVWEPLSLGSPPHSR